MLLADISIMGLVSIFVTTIGRVIGAATKKAEGENFFPKWHFRAGGGRVRVRVMVWWEWGRALSLNRHAGALKWLHGSKTNIRASQAFGWRCTAEDGAVGAARF